MIMLQGARGAKGSKGNQGVSGERVGFVFSFMSGSGELSKFFGNGNGSFLTISFSKGKAKITRSGVFKATWGLLEFCQLQSTLA